MKSVRRLPAARLEREHHYLELLVRAGEILDQSLNYQETLGNVCQAAVMTLADICLVDLGSDDDLRLAAYAHRDRTLRAKLRSAGDFLRDCERGVRHPVWRVLQSQSPVLVPVVDETYISSQSTSPRHEAFMRDMGYASLMIVPLISKSQGKIGAITLARTGPDATPYDQTDLRFAMDLARRCASAIAKSMLHAQTLNIATHFQAAALPNALPSIPGIKLDALYEPSSEELLVGGDWYDAFALPDGRIAITIGDVLGHGIEAAVWMGRLRNSLRATLFTDPDPARALTVVDRLLRAEARNDEFSTALVAIVDPLYQTMTCASAGHPGPLVWDAGTGKSTDPFDERSLPLGLRQFGEGAKVSQNVTMRPGCFAVFFTDGLLEWNRDIGAAWNRLIDALQHEEIRDAPLPAQAVREHVIDGSRHQDDLAILTLRVNELVRPEIHV